MPVQNDYWAPNPNANVVTGPPPSPTEGAAAGGTTAATQAGSTPPASSAGPKPVTTATAGPMVVAGTPPRMPHVKKLELLALTSQLAIMTKSGIDLAGALQSLARQAKRPGVKQMLTAIHQNVLGGQSFSQALHRYERVFGQSFVASVAAGEASGRLPDVLQQLAKLLRSEMRLRSTVRTILAYPVLLTLVSLVVVSSLVIFVLPQFAQIFNQFDMALPVLTQMLLSVSTELQTRFWLWIPAALALSGGSIAFLYSAMGRRLLDRFALYCPVIREVTRALLIGRTCRMLGIMIGSGVPLLQTLKLVGSSTKNHLYRELFAELSDDVVNGQGLSDGLLASSFVPPSAAEMIVTAEQTGSLAMVTEMIGEHFEEDGESRLRELVTILEPVIIVAMGILVAVIVLSVMLPMFELATLG